MNTISNPGLRWTLTGLACAALLAPGSIGASVGNIDAVEKYAWSENGGWANFRPTHGGVTAHATYLSGFAWSESVGWIKLGADGDGPYTNTNAINWGVNRDAVGDLSGFAWSENAGWINFNPTHGQVRIDPSTGEFDGFAWSEGLGWIHFRNESIPYAYGVKQDRTICVTGDPDSDLDGLVDGCDNCPEASNPSQADNDGDFVGNACDNCPVNPNEGQADGDGDGRGDTCDNCPLLANTSQQDNDADGFGDVCDNCPNVANLDQEDADGDDIGDACDSCTDNDGDGFGDPGPDDSCELDNCPADFNPEQNDADGDGIGDVCDDCTDTDGDGWPNPEFPGGGGCGTPAFDNCPTEPNPLQEDLDFDSAGDVCDCAASDPAVFPGASEINDGMDNQCPGEHGYGVVDEISGGIRAVWGGLFEWEEQAGATLYRMVRSSAPDFSADPCECSPLGGTCSYTTTNTYFIDSQQMIPGLTPLLWYYLVRAEAPNVGSWGEDSGGFERLFTCGSELACADGVDNDQDGFTDCDDPDCAAACTATFTFVDTTGDDIPSTALFDFFESIQAGPTDYILFEIDRAPEANAWCAERADWYRDEYLSRALSGSSAGSGSWSKWYRHELTGGEWVGPDNASYLHLWGFACAIDYTWCAESGLGGFGFRMIHPTLLDACEIMDEEVPGGNCGDGTWSLTIKVGPTRAAACGF